MMEIVYVSLPFLFCWTDRNDCVRKSEYANTRWLTEYIKTSLVKNKEINQVI